MSKIENPILKGFNPDPSIIRVDEDYYIATSTFEWYPGVQIHHSKDLKNWKLITRPLDRGSQLNMMGESNSCGVWAPCLTYDKGIYYLTYTDVKSPGSTHNYVVTADSILGPWSDPVYLDSRGFDPSLFHDDDGRKWYTVMLFDHIPWNFMVNANEVQQGNKTSDRIHAQYNKLGRPNPLFKGIMLQEYDPVAKKLIGKAKKIFHNEIGYTEGSHQYKRNGWYYLMMAEGGTSYGHCETLVRSRNIDGPYEIHPQNPIIRSTGTDAYLQKTGHADIVDTPDGETYLVHLCGRPLDPENSDGCILGRETAIQKMEWGDDDWLRLANGTQVGERYVDGPKLEEYPFPEEPTRDDFDSKELDINFQWLRGPISDQIFSLSDRAGYLRLYGKEMIVSDNMVSLIARRQQSFSYTASTSMEFSPDEENQMAGLIVMYSNILHYYPYVGWDEKIGTYISIMSNNNRDVNIFVIDPIVIEEGKTIYLKADVNEKDLQFYYGYSEDSFEKIGPILDMMKLSDENSGGFTGAFVGMACNDPATMTKYADFDFFEYIEK